MIITILMVLNTSQTLLLCNLEYLGQYLSYCIQTWHDGRLMDALYYAHARFDDLDFDARLQWVSKSKTISVACSRQLSKQ